MAKAAYTEHRTNALPICGRCREAKQPEEMAKSSSHLCKPCQTRKTQEWAEANPSEWEAHRRRSYLKRKYGITPEKADELLAQQGGRCAICRTGEGDSRGFRMHIDHDHVTGKVRGILCNTCNSGLGNFRDDEDRLLKAVEYLRLHAQGDSG